MDSLGIIKHNPHKKADNSGILRTYRISYYTHYYTT